MVVRHGNLWPGVVLAAIGSGLVGSILIFALTIERLGLIPASALCALVISLASREMKWSHTLGLGLVVVLPVAVWLIFSVSLGLQAPAFR